jgi:hypothetical protein
MKTPSLFSSVLIALLAAGLAAECQASPWSSKLQMTVVAEQADPTAKLTPPTADQPAYYVAFDGGYIEAGDPIGGERPPTAAAVSQALHAALGSQHYLPATTTSAPSLLLVYHWGLLSRDTHQIRSIFDIQPNLKARIALVASRKYVQRMEQDIMDRRQPVSVHIPIFDPVERDLLELAGDDRYFVIVSVYDYASVARNEGRLLWRAKMSTRSAGASMVEALPTLLRGGAPYFGRDLADTQYANEPLVREGRVEVGTPKVEEFLPPPQVTQQLSKSYLDQLLHQERVKFSGELPSDADRAGDPAPGASASAVGNSFLPPALAARIKTYEQEKSALQEALTARVKERTPGADTRQAIDAFDRENAARIAALTSERRAIRDELAKLAAANTDAATGKSLQTLQQEFAAGVQQLESESAPAAP